ncbi:cytochrome c [Candidatus Methylospira mobilis]|uniref:Cytochrome c n=2 Tax=Candidatus Methylospira mobilis TaxID=1808979 RepID=A0A5Q0BML2_9GAMM|nr:cytochrome c [Candidatus Methylospira mobilis]
MQANAATPALGSPLGTAEAASWNFSVFPDGRGLPPGSGTPQTGKVIYEQRCACCHGVNGSGGSADELAGAQHGLKDAEPDKTIGSYWPYAPTLFDYIRRAMPADAPGSLSNDELYAVTAYLLYLNRLAEPSVMLNAKTLPPINMPNRNGFVGVDAKR